MAKDTFDYQSTSRALDELLERLQGGELSIDEAIGEYQRGLALLGQLEAYLKTATNKITKLKI